MTRFADEQMRRYDTASKQKFITKVVTSSSLKAIDVNQLMDNFA